MGFKDDRNSSLEVFDTSLQVDHIHHVANGISQLLTFFWNLPIWFAACWFESCVYRLFEETHKPEISRLFLPEVPNSKIHLKRGFAVHLHEKEGCDKGVEDTTDVGEGVQNFQKTSIMQIVVAFTSKDDGVWSGSRNDFLITWLDGGCEPCDFIDFGFEREEARVSDHLFLFQIDVYSYI